MRKRTRTFLGVTALIGSCILVGGTAVSVGGDQVSSASEPQYEHNPNGNSFGSASDARHPDKEPDLILVVATNEKIGYVYKDELDSASGSNQDFKSPQEALAWQENEGAQDRLIPVYEVDGETQIGEFLIVGAHTQAELERELQPSAAN